MAWGTTVLTVKEFLPGQSVAFGSGPGAIIALPDGRNIAPIPIRAVPSGWQIDNYGVSDGVLQRGGRQEDPTQLIPPVPLGPGDWGLLQYGSLSLFFQLLEAAPTLKRNHRLDKLTLLAVLTSAVLHAAVWGALLAIAAPRQVRPAELCSVQQLADRFGIKRWIADSPVVSASFETAEAHSAPEQLIDYRELSDDYRRALGSVRSLMPSPQGGATTGPRPADSAGNTVPTVVGGKTITLLPASAAVWGGLSKDSIERVAMEHMPQLQSCTDAEVVPTSEFRGALELTLTVAPNGSVNAAETSAAPRRLKLEACIVQQAKTSWRYPASSAPSHVKYSFRLGSGTSP